MKKKVLLNVILRYLKDVRPHFLLKKRIIYVMVKVIPDCQRKSMV